MFQQISDSKYSIMSCFSKNKNKIENLYSIYVFWEVILVSYKKLQLLLQLSYVTNCDSLFVTFIWTHYFFSLLTLCHIIIVTRNYKKICGLELSLFWTIFGYKVYLLQTNCFPPLKITVMNPSCSPAQQNIYVRVKDIVKA